MARSLSKGQNGITQLTGIERACSTNGIYYTRSSFSCISVVSNSTSSSSRTNLYSYYLAADIVDSTSPKFVVSAKPLPLLAAPTESRPVICHVRQECIALRRRTDGLPSLIANINHGSDPLRYLTLVRPRQSSTDPRSLTKLELEAV